MGDFRFPSQRSGRQPVTSERIPLGAFLLGRRDRASTDRSLSRVSLQVFLSSGEERVRLEWTWPTRSRVESEVY